MRADPEHGAFHRGIGDKAGAGEELIAGAKQRDARAGRILVDVRGVEAGGGKRLHACLAEYGLAESLVVGEIET